MRVEKTVYEVCLVQAGRVDWSVWEMLGQELDRRAEQVYRRWWASIEHVFTRYLAGKSSLNKLREEMAHLVFLIGRFSFDKNWTSPPVVGGVLIRVHN